MTKDEVMKFLDTASTEVFSEIRQRMTQIVKDRNFQDYLDKNKWKTDRTKRICELHDSGMTFNEIGVLYDITGKRCREIYKKEKQWQQIRGQA